MTLPQRPLGWSRVMITKTGFGAWAIGGGGWAFGWGPQNDAVSLATVRHALQLGVNWIDTAAVYGLGHSEEVVGRLMREPTPSERPMVFTKMWIDPGSEQSDGPTTTRAQAGID
jgi:aryl-alcohol dehydrogenase-like predicted oxidoreductase